MNANSTARVVVEPGGEGVVAHVGLHALGCFADRLGLGDALSTRIPLTGEPHFVQNLIGAQPTLKFMSMAVSWPRCGPTGSGSLLAASIPASAAPCIAATRARVDSKRSVR